MPKIMHGSLLIIINLSVVGFCWLTAEQPATANSVAITPIVRIVPISLAISTFRKTPKDVQTTGSSFTLIDAPAATIAFNVDAMFSRGLIILGDHNRLANSITENQLLLLDKQSNLNLPAQPASGVIESYINQGRINAPRTQPNVR